mgnify:CR=1 FL=1
MTDTFRVYPSTPASETQRISSLQLVCRPSEFIPASMHPHPHRSHLAPPPALPSRVARAYWNGLGVLVNALFLLWPFWLSYNEGRCALQ